MSPFTEYLDYSGISDNEITDELVRNGSSTSFAGPQPATGIVSNLLIQYFIPANF